MDSTPRRRTGPIAAIACCVGLIGCQSLPVPAFLTQQPDTSSSDEDVAGEVYRRAEIERAEWFEQEVERLRADLEEAEESIVAMESGLRGSQSRAHAVSALAEARIALERVQRKAPWRAQSIAEANSKLEDAALQLKRGHISSALFFASRAKRLTNNLEAEVKRVSEWSDRRMVSAERINLRAGPHENRQIIDVLVRDTPVFPERSHGSWHLVRTPAGQVGWVHQSLLRLP